MVRYPPASSSATIRWTARSVMPTRAATSRMRISGSPAMQIRTWAWLLRNVHEGVAPPSFDLSGKTDSEVRRANAEVRAKGDRGGLAGGGEALPANLADGVRR